MADQPTILVVEDSPDVRTLLKGVLSFDYHVEMARDGGEALDYLAGQLPDLVLTDVRMPGMGGFDLCREIRRRPRLERLPVIFLSACSDLNEKVEGLEAGADDYVLKPFRSRELLARIGNTLRSRRLEQDLKRKTEELEHTLEELRRSREKALEAERLATTVRLAATLAHEINNPLAGILGVLDLLDARIDDEPALDDIETLRQQARRIADVVKRITQLKEVRFTTYVGSEEMVDLEP